jgi:kinesin family protein 5
VVELEISLDETREQYNNVLRTSNNRAQQKKMMFLERNLEQLTVVQRQLVEQNSSLKKEVAIAERKLIARNERIQSLESLLQDSQEKLTAANHRYVIFLVHHVPSRKRRKLTAVLASSPNSQP